jgi:hypothetical protein
MTECKAAIFEFPGFNARKVSFHRMNILENLIRFRNDVDSQM